jgi:hypothetical protein
MSEGRGLCEGSVSDRAPACVCRVAPTPTPASVPSCRYTLAGVLQESFFLTDTDPFEERQEACVVLQTAFARGAMAATVQAAIGGPVRVRASACVCMCVRVRTGMCARCFRARVGCPRRAATCVYPRVSCCVPVHQPCVEPQWPVPKGVSRCGHSPATAVWFEMVRRWWWCQM